MRSFGRLTIRTYLLLGFSLLATLPVLLLGGMLSQQLEAAQVQQSQRQIDSVAANLADDIGQYLDVRAAELDGFARQVEAQPSLDPTILKTLILRRRVQSGHFTFLSVRDRSGASLGSDPAESVDEKMSAAAQTMRRTAR
jgi:hypothetical protein